MEQSLGFFFIGGVVKRGLGADLYADNKLWWYGAL